MLATLACSTPLMVLSILIAVSVIDLSYIVVGVLLFVLHLMYISLVISHGRYIFRKRKNQQQDAIVVNQNKSSSQAAVVPANAE
jgi:hypothetical protein